MSSSRTDASIVEVSMPQMGVSVAEGTIIEWRKRPGDWVEADESICDVSTDKIDVEIPSPASGRLERILIEPGETVPVGTPLAELDTAAEPGEAHPEESPSPRADRPSEATARFRSGSGEAPRLTARGSTRQSCAGSPTSTGVDLEQVEGTGVGGRVRKVGSDGLPRGRSGRRRRGRSGRCTSSRPTSPSRSRPPRPRT